MGRMLCVAAAATLVAGCVGQGDNAEVRQSPLDTAVKILELHGLKGRLPDARSEKVRRTAPNREALGRLFIDYDKEDPFLADLYVGFVAGVLSVNQDALQVRRDRTRAEIKAGKARIFLNLKDGMWRVSLAESVPAEIKARAKMEKLRVAANSAKFQ